MGSPDVGSQVPQKNIRHIPVIVLARVEQHFMHGGLIRNTRDTAAALIN